MTGLRVGVDIGGTFTDLCVLDESGAVAPGKVLTTRDEPARAVEEGLKRTLADAGSHADDVEQFVHGTTLVTNALIEREGARTALPATAGFRDVLEIRRKVAVVFGGARGIGLATVKEFVAEGTAVFSSDVRELAEPAEGVRHSLVDAADEGQVDEFVLAETDRVGEAWEVAKAVVFPAGDESRSGNGVALPIDGAEAAGALPGNRYGLDFELGVR
ncbi:hydantoinase/oxoprolinase N-terminal domain-containing protein [Amycolatopsis sp. QT-25]|uniref:hydantoinase/oxoprolinase N-terminal domain-containing protein n=1 Tax=Amycolatopsis sp. QT-25 TaxID=3034022 RepID=UPI0023ED81F6|nr:hydantoinase/oxoprolinase N-terminal domain-containing protein [Amycolatopsis sp. QT-25]WET78369.1 hydantoinase/oxoprolinase N-terminal domain-containing protein [Amycolatopsis sp. QT-25]